MREDYTFYNYYCYDKDPIDFKAYVLNQLRDLGYFNWLRDEPRNLTDEKYSELVKTYICSLMTFSDDLGNTYSVAWDDIAETLKKAEPFVKASEKMKEAGASDGFIILYVNDKAVKSPEDVIEIAKNSKRAVFIEGVTASGRTGYFAFGI